VESSAWWVPSWPRCVPAHWSGRFGSAAGFPVLRLQAAHAKSLGRNIDLFKPAGPLALEAIVKLLAAIAGCLGPWPSGF